MISSASLKWGLILLSFVLVEECVLGADRFVTVRDCKSDEYLDTTNLQCYQCTQPPNMNPSGGSGYDSRVTDLSDAYKPFVARSYTVASGCTCATGYIKRQSDFNSTETCLGLDAINDWCDAFRCDECAESSSLERTRCMSCSNATDSNSILFDPATKKCKCSNPDHVLREEGPNGELLSAKICEPCPAGSVLRSAMLKAQAATSGANLVLKESDDYVCQKCPHPAMVVHQNQCVCALPGDNNPTWTQVGTPGIGEGPTCILSFERGVVNQPRLAEIQYTHVVPFVDYNLTL